MTTIQQLDLALNIFKQKDKYINIHNLSVSIAASLAAIGLENEMLSFKTLMILEKLKKDNYIYLEISNGEEFYSITIDGLIFIGYEKQQILDNDQVISASQMASSIKRYNIRLLWATWIAGIAAALVLLWQVFLYFYPVHADYPYWFWETIPTKN